eukprot:TRINITY_DN19454_c0_g1_i1.p1 TRINITY_DN19454_c0_g1~~TRINITY_DN19454_c0_g1_i1.p1  ORF type:complete len:158 (+),score=48.46 TRINITY_DN19454_c0_g1_i1:93-566(+)
MAFFFFYGDGDHRDLHYPLRRQRQMCIRDSINAEYGEFNMADMAASEEGAFPHDRVETIINKHVEATIDNAPYSELDVPKWIQTITENVTTDLIGLNKPFKYVVNCIVMENVGAGINTANSAYWDSVHDGVKIVNWPIDRKKNETVTSITSVYGIAI